MDGRFRKHEILGLVYQFIGMTSIGIGIYFAVSFAVRPIINQSVLFTVQTGEWLLFPLFFGLGGVLWALGTIEIKEAMPGFFKRGKK